FTPKDTANKKLSEADIDLMRKMHKAISVVQFKLEGQLIKRRPDFQMDDRLLLDKIDFQKKTMQIKDKAYPINDTYFPTINPEAPYRLTEREAAIMKKITASFLNSHKMKQHMRFLYTRGNLFLTCNSNLLFHGCVPMNPDGSFTDVNIKGKTYRGRALFIRMEQLAREAYFRKDASEEKEFARDIMWYLWCGPRSPLFGKDKMSTLERYFIDDKASHKEINDPY
ncbi:MAG: fructose-1,6-bisphosphatase, partial [bacterium]|nr:fructose-1,6-bisphosphatase [bacterium]